MAFARNPAAESDVITSTASITLAPHQTTCRIYNNATNVTVTLPHPAVAKEFGPYSIRKSDTGAGTVSISAVGASVTALTLNGNYVVLYSDGIDYTNLASLST